MDSELERTLMRPLHRFRSRLEAVGVSLLLGFFVCAGIVAIFGLLAREIFSTARVGPLDQRITLSAPYLHNSNLDRAALTATFFGSHLFVLPATILVTAALLSKGHRVSALLFCGSVAGGFALNSLLKIAFHRVRPDLWRALVVEHTYSFPSGHAAVSTVFFGARGRRAAPLATPRGANRGGRPGDHRDRHGRRDARLSRRALDDGRRRRNPPRLVLDGGGGGGDRVCDSPVRTIEAGGIDSA